MRYLKKYKLFESIDCDGGFTCPIFELPKDMRDDISDLLLELEDKGYLVTFIPNVGDEDSCPFIYISAPGMDWIKKDIKKDIKEVVDRIDSVAKEYGWRVDTLVGKLNDQQVYLYFDKGTISNSNDSQVGLGIKEAFKLKLPDDIKNELSDCFLSLSDLIQDDNRSTNPGVKITGISKNEYRYLEGFGRPGDYVRVIVLPRLKPLSDPNQSFTELSYTPADMDVDLFYDELIDCMNLAESTGFKINCGVVAWSNGGEFKGTGELTKKFKYDGIDPEKNPLSDRGGWSGAYDIEKLDWFLKEVVKDRLRWIKIFYS